MVLARHKLELGEDKLAALRTEFDSVLDSMGLGGPEIPEQAEKRS